MEKGPLGCCANADSSYSSQMQVYISGCEVVILDGRFQRVQIVISQCAATNHVGLISCSQIDGKVRCQRCFYTVDLSIITNLVLSSVYCASKILNLHAQESGFLNTAFSLNILGMQY